MARQIANVSLQVDTFQTHVTRTNDIIDMLGNEVITANSTVGVTGTAALPRNARLFGAFTANTLASNTLYSNTIAVSGASSFGNTTVNGNLSANRGSITANGFVSVAVAGEGGQLILRDANNTYDAYVLDVDGSNHGRLFTLANNTNLSIGQLSGSNGSVKIYTSGSERLHVSANGNVGIGTNNPDFLLDIQGNSNTTWLASRIYNSNTGAGQNAGLQIQTSNTTGVFTAQQTGVVMGSTTNDPISIIANNATTMYITSSGNIGIGNSAPNDKLAVAGSTYLGGNVTVTAGIYANGSYGSPGQGLVSSGSGVYWSNNPGYTGSQGLQGVQGVIGAQGVQGSLGYTGSQGLQGAQGAPASPGTPGGVGYTGSQGLQGVQGAAGAQGAQGAIGAQGVQGATGYTGSRGLQGTQGVQGATGAGYTGSQGLQGAQGAIGAQGATGAGYTGSQGLQGVQGVQGATGAGYTGSQGLQGVQGAVGAGYTGSQGLQGAQGRQGVQGATGSGSPGAQGPQGAPGPTGYTGSLGAQGPQGTGSQGVSVSYTALGVNTPAGPTGTIRATSDITAYYSSDKRFKTNIVPIENALQKLRKLSGVMFDWTDEYIEASGGEDGYFVRKRDTGVIAQEVQQVLPEVVAERPDGTLAVKYEKMIGLIIQAINELSTTVENLKNDK